MVASQFSIRDSRGNAIFNTIEAQKYFLLRPKQNKDECAVGKYPVLDEYTVGCLVESDIYL